MKYLKITNAERNKICAGITNTKKIPAYDKDLNELYKLLNVLLKTKKVHEVKKFKVNDAHLDRFEIGTQTFFCNIFKRKKVGGWDILTIYYIVGENCKNWKDGLYMFVTDTLITMKLNESLLVSLQ